MLKWVSCRYTAGARGRGMIIHGVDASASRMMRPRAFRSFRCPLMRPAAGVSSPRVKQRTSPTTEMKRTLVPASAKLSLAVASTRVWTLNRHCHIRWSYRWRVPGRGFGGARGGARTVGGRAIPMACTGPVPDVWSRFRCSTPGFKAVSVRNRERARLRGHCPACSAPGALVGLSRGFSL